MSLIRSAVFRMAWIGRISGATPTYTGAFEAPLTMSEVLALVKKTGLIVGS